MTPHFATRNCLYLLLFRSARAVYAETHESAQRQLDLAERFEGVAAILREMDIDRIWKEATPAERRVLIEELIEAVVVYPDHLQVQGSGTPPLNVTLAEVGLRDPGTRTSVSEARWCPHVHLAQ